MFHVAIITATVLVAVAAAAAPLGRLGTLRRLTSIPTANSTGGALFGTACSQCPLDTDEAVVFQHRLAFGEEWGVVNHVWATAVNKHGVVPHLQNTTFRLYVDGDAARTLAFTLPAAVGSFGEQRAPWGTRLFGKGAATGGFFFNLPVPFRRNVTLTVQYDGDGGRTAFWTIVRGAREQPIRVGDFDVPIATAPDVWLQLSVVRATLRPLQLVDVATVERGVNAGVVALHALHVDTVGKNFLEGCYHYYSGEQQAFPGLLLSSGTEDFFDSAFYFDAGEFNLPVSGYTQGEYQDNRTRWSAYRSNVDSPLVFEDGVRVQWRNGDVTDPATGTKCTTIDGHTIGKPHDATIHAVTWTYVWTPETPQR